VADTQFAIRLEVQSSSIADHIERFE